MCFEVIVERKVLSLIRSLLGFFGFVYCLLKNVGPCDDQHLPGCEVMRRPMVETLLLPFSQIQWELNLSDIVLQYCC